MPFDRADRRAVRPRDRRAPRLPAGTRAANSLTFRALGYGPPPDEHWVVIGYRDLTGRDRARCGSPGGSSYPGRASDREPRGATRSRQPRHRPCRGSRPPGQEADASSRRSGRPNGRVARQPQEGSLARRDYQGLPVGARTVKTRQGEFGYLRIWSFDVDDDQKFLEATLESAARPSGARARHRLCATIPGGFIWAAERLLQVFTPNPITPTKFALRTTPVTVNLATSARSMQGEFGPWADSLSTAEQTGEPYSMPPADHQRRAMQRPRPAATAARSSSSSTPTRTRRAICSRRGSSTIASGRSCASVPPPAPAARTSGRLTTCATRSAATGHPLPELRPRDQLHCRAAARGAQWRRRRHADRRRGNCRAAVSR